MNCGARANDLFNRGLFARFGLSFVIRLGFGADNSAIFCGGVGVLLIEVAEQALLSLGGRDWSEVVAAKDLGGNEPILSDECGLNFGDVSFQTK